MLTIFKILTVYTWAIMTMHFNCFLNTTGKRYKRHLLPLSIEEPELVIQFYFGDFVM